MAHFFGSIGNNTGRESTRCGTKNNGLGVIAASHAGAVRTTLYHDETTGRDMARVELIKWRGLGAERVLYEGPVDPVAVTLAEGTV